MGRKARTKKKGSPVAPESPVTPESPGTTKVLQERREVPRVGADLGAYFRVVSGDGGEKSKEVSASVENLSEAGCCLATDLIMVNDLHILSSSMGTAGNSLEIRIPLTGEREVRILGATSWYNKADARSRHRYKVGVKTTHISEEDRLTMRQVLPRSFREKLKALGARWMGRLRGSGKR